MTVLEVEVDSSLKSYFAGEAAAVVAGAREAIKRQTDETKRDARAVVNAGLTGSRLFRTGNRRVAQTIRSKLYLNTPAGFVHSSWGYFDGGKFVDILATHEQGLTITPRRRKFLFIPFVGGARRRKLRRDGLSGEKVDLIPTPTGGLLVVTRATARRKGLVLGLLVKQVKIPKRLDFRETERQVEADLPGKLVVEMERASVRLQRRR